MDNSKSWFHKIIRDWRRSVPLGRPRSGLQSGEWEVAMSITRPRDTCSRRRAHREGGVIEFRVWFSFQFQVRCVQSSKDRRGRRIWYSDWFRVDQQANSFLSLTVRILSFIEKPSDINNSFVNNIWGWGWNTPSVSSSISSTCTGTAWSSRKKMRRSGGKYPDPPGSHRCATDVDLRMCVLMSLHLLHAKLCKHKYTTYLRSTPFRQYLCAIAATGRRRVLANKWSCKMPANGGKLQFERRGDSPFISNRCELRAYRLSVVTETKEGGR